MQIHRQAVPVAWAELPRVVVQLQQSSRERAVRTRDADILSLRHVRRQQVNRATEIGGTEIGSLSRAAVEIHAAYPLRREISPGMMRGRVGVLEGNAVERDRVLAVLKAAEIDFGLAQPDPVGVQTERARR